MQRVRSRVETNVCSHLFLSQKFFRTRHHIVEQLFSWPGLGLMTMSAILSRDYPVIMGVCLLAAVVVLAANLVTDILYAVVDPSIQYD